MNILKILTPERLLGNYGERAARRHLKKNGYKILKSSYEALGYEIDVIARKDNILAFVEVKTRNTEKITDKEPRPSSSVTPEKQKKIISAASYYNAHNPSDNRLRFDVIEVYTFGELKRMKIQRIVHIENAFDINTAYKKH